MLLLLLLHFLCLLLRTPDSTQSEAVAVDEELMGPLGFSVDQLMELAGLSVAASLAAEFPPQSHKCVPATAAANSFKAGV